MPKLWKVPSSRPASHEEVFTERYERLLDWAFRLTEQNQQRAEDLVHDTFVQFVLRRPNLNEIENLDGYLYVALRNAQLSHARRAAHDPQRNLSLLDYDSLEITLRAVEPSNSLQVQNELRLICRYACDRKESSKAGSVLLLRFFRGYYPSEIAQIILSTRPIVARWLQVARAEARLYLEDPGALTFLTKHSRPVTQAEPYIQETKELLRELADSTSNSKQGSCLLPGQLKGIYGARVRNGVDCATLAHLVSCACCLDRVNDVLGLPKLAQRYPTDTIDRDQPGGHGPSGSGSVRDRIRRGRRRLKETFEHRPKELRIAANGYLVGSQKISSEKSEQEVSLNLTEPLSFIEVFSEQRLKLLSLPVTPPPEGPFDQEVRIALSDERVLEASVKFTGTWPALRVVYRDPLFDQFEAPLSFEEDLEPAGRQTAAASIKRERLRFTPQSLGLIKRFARWLFDSGFWLRPGTATAIVATILIAAVLFVQFRRPISSLSVADVLQRSVVAEEAIAAKPDQILHRTISLEERKVAQTSVCQTCPGDLIARRKIEIWRSVEKGITARRLYDDRGQLLAGDWRRADGVQTIYHHGARPQLQLAPEKRSPTAINFENVWQLDLAAKDFSSLTGNPDTAKVEERGNTYILSVEFVRSAETSGSSSVSSVVNSQISATLVLNRNDLHPIEQTLVIRERDETREYRFIETVFEQKAKHTVAPKVFEPEAELLSSNNLETPNSKIETDSPLPLTASPVAASADLEVQILRLLQQAGADLGEQINVTRTSEGQLQIQGIVETDERKRELLRALDSVKSNPAVKIQISSAAEAARKLHNTSASSGAIVVERSESGVNTIPVEPELRRHFAARGMSRQQIETSIQHFANTVVNRSSQVLQHAWALKRLVERFSPAELRNLSPEARANWLAMIREHSRALQRANSALRQDLQPIFFPASAPDNAEEGIEIKTDADLVRSAERLLGICTSNHKLVSAAFTVSSDSSSGSAIKSAQFLRSLASAENLAVKIGRQ